MNKELSPSLSSAGSLVDQEIPRVHKTTVGAAAPTDLSKPAPPTLLPNGSRPIAKLRKRSPAVASASVPAPAPAPAPANPTPAPATSTSTPLTSALVPSRIFPGVQVDLHLEVKRLQEEIKDQEAKLEKAAALSSALSTRVREQRSETKMDLEKIAKERDAARDELEALKERKKTSDASFEEHIQDIEDKLEEETKKLQDAKTEVETLKVSITTLNNAAKERELYIASSEDAFLEAKKDAEDAQRAKERAEEKIAEKDKFIAKLQENEKAHNLDMLNKSVEASGLSKQLNTANKKAEEDKIERERLQGEITDLNAQITGYQAVENERDALEEEVRLFAQETRDLFNRAADAYEASTDTPYPETVADELAAMLNSSSSESRDEEGHESEESDETEKEDEEEDEEESTQIVEETPLETEEAAEDEKTSESSEIVQDEETVEDETVVEDEEPVNEEIRTEVPVPQIVREEVIVYQDRIVNVPVYTERIVRVPYTTTTHNGFRCWIQTNANVINAIVYYILLCIASLPGLNPRDPHVSDDAVAVDGDVGGPLAAPRNEN